MFVVGHVAVKVVAISPRRDSSAANQILAGLSYEPYCFVRCH